LLKGPCPASTSSEATACGRSSGARHETAWPKQSRWSACKPASPRIIIKDSRPVAALQPIDAEDLELIPRLTDRQARRFIEWTEAQPKKSFRSGAAARFTGSRRTWPGRLETEQQAAVLRALLQLDTAFAQPHEHHGLGLRKLHPAYSEMTAC
jgi:hypothetical protein